MDPDTNRYKDQLSAGGKQNINSDSTIATPSPHTSPLIQQAGSSGRSFVPSMTVNGARPQFQTPHRALNGSTATPAFNAYDPFTQPAFRHTNTDSGMNLSPAVAFMYDSHHAQSTSTPTPQNVNGKRKRQQEQDNPTQRHPALKTSMVSASPLAIKDKMLRQGQVPTTGMMRQFEGAWNNYPDMTRDSTIHTTMDAYPQSERVRQLFTPPSIEVIRPSLPASSKRVNDDDEGTVEAAATDDFRSGSAETDPMHQLAFEPDMYEFSVEYMFFLTVGDQKKAQSRGFQDARQVYRERMRRPNILTIDINLAYVPGPGYLDSSLPWQPICGPAAYIGAVRGDLRLKFAPGEKIYIGEREIQPDEEIDIPMLHNEKQVLWNRVDYQRTEYAHSRQTNADTKDTMHFIASQAEWSPRTLPPSAAILEPLRTSKTKVPCLVDPSGNIVRDANGQERRAFDHVLPAHISNSVEGWLIAAWIAEDPRIQWKDIEANMTPGKDSIRLRERYAKYRDSVAAMTRDTHVTNRSTPTKGDMKTVQHQQHENLAGNSWWFVDMASKRICQSEAPMKALYEGRAAYGLPISKKSDGKYSKRVRAAKDVMEKESADAEDADIYEVRQK